MGQKQGREAGRPEAQQLTLPQATPLLVEGNGHALVLPDGLAVTFPRTPGRYERWVKPAWDRLGGVVLGVAALPLIGIVAAGVALRMGRPVLLGQRRVGLGGRVFVMYKFRTMEPDRRLGQQPYDGQDRRRLHKSPEDPRHTGLGRFLRKWSLDELPQLWHVITGEMSLVGPRPELLEIVEQKYQPWQNLRHVVKPGLTGLWQVSARDGGVMYEHTDVDLEYVARISWRLDCKILLYTLPAALGMRKGF